MDNTKNKFKWKAMVISLFIYICLVMFVTEGDFGGNPERFLIAFLGCVVVGMATAADNEFE